MINFEFWEKEHPRAGEAMEVEYHVFVEWGYIAPNQKKRALEYDKYSDYRFLIGLDKEKIVAVTRNIFDTDSLPTLNYPTTNDFNLWPKSFHKILGIGKEKFCETGTMAVIPEYQGHNYSINLIDELVREYNPKGIFYTICALDQGFYDFLLSLEMPFEQIGDPKYYMGSTTVPAIFDSTVLEPDFFRNLLR
ncbi:MAG: GNAT family N-acyltransferase [Desulfobacteraceae bacterium]